jgi:Protein of unknown function (DUF3102)
MLATLDTGTDTFLTYRAGAIRALGKRMVSDILEIGRLLTECKDHLHKTEGHGSWLPWLEEEFGWSDDTALNFMHAHNMGKSRNFRDLNLSVSAVYKLAAPSTPDEARDAVISRAQNGEALSLAEVQRMVDEAKSAQAAEHERQLEALTDRYQREAEQLRADIGDQLSPEALQTAIDEALAPLQNKINRLEAERDKRAKEGPKRPDPHGLPATAIVNALHSLALTLTITPKQVIARHEMVAEATEQRLTALIAEPVRDAKTAVKWLERFIEEAGK